MTPQEYKTRFEALKKQEVDLAQEFINDNPLKSLEGKLVNLTTGCRHQKVLFVGADLLKDEFGKPKEPAYFFHRLKKDGTPRKNADFIQIRFYDGILHKIEKICPTKK